MITGADIEFGPSQPIAPMAPNEPIRQADYPVGRNLIVTPRGAESRAVSYAEMRALADASPILRSVIEDRKEVIKGLKWTIGVKEEYQHLDFSGDVKEITRLFSRPDGDNTFDQWMGILCEDLLVCDNMTIYPRMSKSGGVISFDPVDGDTITVLTDGRGRIPQPPEPAYMQIIKGHPRTWYDHDHLVYRPYNLRSKGVYGTSHVENIIMTINIALRRDIQFLEHFRSGNIPHSLIQAPKEWTADQIEKFQRVFDLMLAGDLANRSKMILVPGGGSPAQPMAQLTFDAQFDEWLARIICHRFGVSPTPFVRMNNRATAETIEENATEKSIVPLMQHFKSVFDSLIEHQCGKPHLEFVWTTQQLHYRMEDASINSTLLHDGVITLDHVRKMRGLPPLPDGLGKDPMVWTQGGPVLLRDVRNSAYQQQQAPMGIPSPAVSQPASLPQLSLTREPETEDDVELPELSLKSELSAWETYALKRLGKANTRPFECKAVPEALAVSIRDGLKSASDPKAVKAVFEQARRNLTRKRTPPVEGNLDQLMTEYEDLIKTAVEKAKNAAGSAMKSWDENEHPRDNDGKFTDGNGGGGNGSKQPKNDNPKSDKPATSSTKLSGEAWANSMSAHEKALIFDWQGTGYQHIREAQMKGIKDSDYVDKINALNELLDRAEPYEGELWRGMHNVPSEYYNKLLQDDIIVLTAFSSSSKSQEQAEYFVLGSGIEMGTNWKQESPSVMIHITKNKTGVDITPASNHSFADEEEVILRDKAKYRVISREEKTIRVVDYYKTPVVNFDIKTLVLTVEEI